MQLLFCTRGIQRLKTEKGFKSQCSQSRYCQASTMHSMYSSQWTATLLVQRKRSKQNAKRANIHSYMLWLLCYQTIFGCLHTKQSFTNTRPGKEITAVITAVFTSDTHIWKLPHNPTIPPRILVPVDGSCEIFRVTALLYKQKGMAKARASPWGSAFNICSATHFLCNLGQASEGWL